jgi:hypothetical protein
MPERLHSGDEAYASVGAHGPDTVIDNEVMAIKLVCCPQANEKADCSFIGFVKGL